MDIYTSDDEKAELIKAWLKKYGLKIIVVFLLMWATAFAYEYYAEKQLEKNRFASMLYYNVLSSYSDNDNESAETNLAKLRDGYSSTSYAWLSSLVAANKVGSLEERLELLELVERKCAYNEIVELAKIRSARVLWQQGSDEKAIKKLSSISLTEFKATADELLGDIYFKQGDKLKSLEYYKKSSDSVYSSPMLNAKLMDLEVV